MTKFLLIILSWLLPVALCAQTASTGALTGIITDPSGAAIADAAVKVTNEATGEVRAISSEPDGTYAATLLAPGVYTVEATKPGFKTAMRKGLNIAVTETDALNIALELGETKETVTITAEPELVQTQSSALGRVVDERAVSTLPLVTRNFTQILGLSPGVTMSVQNAGELGRGSGGSEGNSIGDKHVNGGRQYDNNFQMNGVQVNDEFAAGVRFGGADIGGGVPIPNPDTIEEFKLQSGQYDASFGRNAGANVNIITKGGSNVFHGSLFEFFRNEHLNANDFFANLAGQPRAELRQNQFGLTVGGPVKKDKLLLFGSYQGTRQRNGIASQCSARVFSPLLTNDRSAAALGKLFAGKTGQLGGVAILPDGSNINPVALELLNLKLPNGQYLMPTPQAVVNNQGFSAFSQACPFNEDQFMINSNFIQSSKSLITERLFIARSDQAATFPNGNVPIAPQPTLNQYQNGSLGHTYTISAAMVNELDFGFNHVDVLQKLVSPFKFSDLGVAVPAQGDDLPNITITGSYNARGSSPQDIEQQSWNLVDSLSYIRGDHTLRFGGSLTRAHVDISLYRQPVSLTFLSFPDFLLGLPAGQVASGGNGSNFSNVSSSSNITNLADRQFRRWNGALYAQDDYKATRRLTFNLGLRYERIGNVTDALGRLSGFDFYHANPNPPASGSLQGFVVASNYSGGSLPPQVTRLDNPYALNGEHQNTFAPRFGFAWQETNNGRYVLRGGYGVYYSTTPILAYNFTALTEPWSIVSGASGANNANASFQKPFAFPLASVSSLPMFVPYSPTTLLNGTTLDQDFRPGMTQQFSLNQQVQIARNLLLEVGYVGTRGTHLLETISPNQALLVSPSNPIRGLTTDTVANIQQRVPVLGFSASGLNFVQSQGDSWFNGLETSLTKRFSRGLQFLISYTFSKTLDTDAANVVSTSEGAQTVGNQLDRHSRYGRAAFDRTHRVVLSYTYDFPALQSASTLINKLANGWEIAGVTTLQSGQALTITGTNSNNIFGITNDKAELAPGCTASQIVTPGSISNKLNNYFNRTCFTAYPIIGADGRGTAFGNSGAGIVDGPGQANWDIVLLKRTKLGWPNEVANLEFRTEFFNAFNTPQFSNPTANFSSSTFGVISSTAVNPRMIQLALKLNF